MAGKDVAKHIVNGLVTMKIYLAGAGVLVAVAGGAAAYHQVEHAHEQQHLQRHVMTAREERSKLGEKLDAIEGDVHTIDKKQAVMIQKLDQIIGGMR